MPVREYRGFLSLFILALAAATLLALLATFQAGIALAYLGQPVPWTGLMRARLVDWYPYGVFLPILTIVAGRWPIDRPHLPRSVLPWLLLGPPLALLKELIYVTIGNYARPGLFDLRQILSEDFSAEVVTAWAIIALAHVLAARRGPARDGEPDKPAAFPATLSVPTRHGWQLISRQNIELVEAHGNYVRLVTSHGSFMLRTTMTALERRLGPGFMRIHRSTMVNVDRVERISSRSHAEYRITLASGACVNSARGYYGRVRTLLAMPPNQ